MIYGVIEESDETHIKIGYAQSNGEQVDTKAAVNRVKQYQTGNRRDLYVICGVSGTVQDEKSLHKQFAKQWDGGEWFAVDAQVKAWIDTCRLPQPARVRKQKTARMIKHAAPPIYGPRAQQSRMACLHCTQSIQACKCGLPSPVTLMPGNAIWNGIVASAYEIAEATRLSRDTKAWPRSARYGCLGCSRPCASCTCAANSMPTLLRKGQWIWRGRVRDLPVREEARPSKAVRELDELDRVARLIKANRQRVDPFRTASSRARCWWPTGNTG